MKTALASRNKTDLDLFAREDEGSWRKFSADSLISIPPAAPSLGPPRMHPKLDSLSPAPPILFRTPLPLSLSLSPLHPLPGVLIKICKEETTERGGKEGERNVFLAMVPGISTKRDAVRPLYIRETRWLVQAVSGMYAQAAPNYHGRFAAPKLGGEDDFEG